ncbi:50S ribosomal protein L9 [Flavobacteriaceae bacterium]|jgi:large subunit ribosomal protein L9|nr:50S ribosomal protein L9 [Flavobacteriaceae bacterium]MBT4298363.1 50S ribosomal protein L9 [Flavobacteriaceae bacterium]MBT4960343.1 50S ribosomal protein L9 [Flavobacteriaceae bacterium]MBT5233594.1 50S ribosomal protein L9 [Flavobacteriaceae bacterium]MBT5493801.1 50S ribosomal protein L9 [Flavobacteriaceae bacterium]|tara:strand:- start:8255 stop:8707 length:453 start_codon:yes stop_codon:yes gene_type:complete
MELILKNDVPNLGFKDDLVSVKNGYGRNYLIPQGLAILATPSSKKVLAENIKQREFKEKKAVDEANKLVKKLSKLDLKIGAKSGTGGKLFGSISSSDLNSELSNLGYDFDKKIIKIMGGSVKRLGTYVATLRLHRNVIHELSFEVIKAVD